MPDILLSGATTRMRASGPGDVLEVEISSDVDEARRVQEEIEDLLKAHHFNERDVFSVKLALEEALVNAIKHGNQMDRRKKVRVQYQVNSHRFEVRIADEGKGFNPEEVPDPIAAENLERPCGRGLLLMRHYMSEVIFHPPGNAVSMVKLREAAHRNGHA